MQIRIEGFILVVALIVMSFVFQIQLKVLVGETVSLIATLQGSFTERLSNLCRSITWWRLFLVGCLAIGLFSVWIIMVAKMELSVALPLASLTLVTNAVGGGLLLGEAISPLRAIGILAVAAGIAMVVAN